MAATSRENEIGHGNAGLVLPFALAPQRLW
jgi:hypothetical protein